MSAEAEYQKERHRDDEDKDDAGFRDVVPGSFVAQADALRKNQRIGYRFPDLGFHAVGPLVADDIRRYMDDSALVFP